MAVSDLYPDRIVENILEELCYEGFDGVSFDRVWELVSKKIKIDDLFKQIIYSWIKNNDHFELTASKTKIVPKPESYEEASKYNAKVTEEYQWLHLTGSPKQNNAIGNSAFQLLVEIAKSRENGIDSLSLTKATGQDARSLTSRIKAISHLINKIQILKNGRTLSLFTLLRFFDTKKLDTISLGSKEEQLTVNLKDLREKIVNTLKAAKSGIRQVNDLRRELELDKSAHLKKVFKSSISYLEQRNYIAKVLVVSPVSPTKKFRSVKYLKDFVHTDENEQRNEDEEDDDEADSNDELINDELKDLEAEEPSGSLRNVVNLQVLETSGPNVPSFNRFYPLQNQIFELVNNHGTTGCSSNYIIEEIFGSSYTRLFSKLIESYTSGKLLPHLASYGLMRHYDFQGRVKFYRYLSRKNFLRLTNQPDDINGATLPPFSAPKSTISKLNKSNYVPLNSKVDLYESDGQLKVYWFGETNSLTPEAKLQLKDKLLSNENSKKKRGRPKKGEPRPEKVIKKPKKGSAVSASVVDDSLTKISQNATEAIENVLVISDIQGTSFRAIERQAGILRVLEDSDGVRQDDVDLLNDVREELGYIVDKKTFKKDLSSLIAQKKVSLNEVTTEEENPITVTLVISSNSTQSTVDAIKESILRKKKANLGVSLKKLDEVSLDIDFFDQELRETFNTVPPPVIVVEKQRVSKVSKPKKERKPKTIKALGSSKSKTFTAKAEPRVDLTSDQTVDDIFENLSKGKKRSHAKTKSSAGKANSAEDQKAKETIGVSNRKSFVGRKKRNLKQLNSEKTSLLFKCVIIYKTIKENQIDWQRIASYLQIDEETIKTKWPRVRMMMGQTGVKLARRQWKKILLAAVKEGKIEMEEILNLELDVLVELWLDSELLRNIEDTGEKLFANIEENHKQFNFVKAEEASNSLQYDNNSMVQREQYLVSRVYTFEEDTQGTIDEKSLEISNEEKIRTIIIALVASGQNNDIKKLSVLEQYTKEEVNEVFVNMAKNREILISGESSKVFLGDRLTGILDDHTYDFSLQKISHFQNVLIELLENNNALALDPIFESSIMVPILELIHEGGLNLTRVDHYRKEVLTGYEARTLEREKLDCDIILTKASKGTDQIKPASGKRVLIPSGKPCSHIWIDVTGNINQEIWVKTIRVLLTKILSDPGITESSIVNTLAPLLTRDDVSLILQWLIDSNAIHKGEFDGIWLNPQWYTTLGVV